MWRPSVIQMGYASLVLILVAGVLITPPATRGSTPAQCYDQTNECIAAEFQTYWDHNGGLDVFGYPITPARPEIDYTTRKIYLAQWFERNRLELHPENRPPYNVLLGRLGVELLRQQGRDPLTLPQVETSTAHYCPQTGQATDDKFWAYWRGHALDIGDSGQTESGCVALFGYPISPPAMEPISNGEPVWSQWFERARFEYHPGNGPQYQVELGLLGNEMKPFRPRTAQDRLNLYREQAGLPDVDLYPALNLSAQNHANYVMLNYDDPSAQPDGAHSEAAGKPGYTGHWPSDRIKVTGYPWVGGAEVMHGLADAAASVDSWMATIYHRVILLDPNARYIGYGQGAHTFIKPDGQQVNIAVDVLDLGAGPDGGPTGPPHPIGYPADKQTQVPLAWDGGESPDPLPPGAPRPVGYPFTLQGAGGVLTVTRGEMRDSAGQVVPAYPNPPECISTFGCYALIPVKPLQPNTTYTVHAQGTVGQVPFDGTWQFTTGGSP
jgi:hypothetical protein